MTQPELLLTERRCKVDGCENPRVAKGYCGSHYMRWRRHGDPLAGGTTPGALRDFIENVAIPFCGDECLTWPFGKNIYGYGYMPHRGKRTTAHRVICEIAHGHPPTARHQAAHNCGKGHEGCCNPRHLRWATPKENHADRVTHGTTSRGEKSSSVKLTSEQVKEIREAIGSRNERGLRSEIARKFGVNRSTITRIINRTDWAWL